MANAKRQRVAKDNFDELGRVLKNMQKDHKPSTGPSLDGGAHTLDEEAHLKAEQLTRTNKRIFVGAAMGVVALFGAGYALLDHFSPVAQGKEFMESQDFINISGGEFANAACPGGSYFSRRFSGETKIGNIPTVKVVCYTYGPEKFVFVPNG